MNNSIKFLIVSFYILLISWSIAKNDHTDTINPNFCKEQKMQSLFNYHNLSGWHIENGGLFSVSEKGILKLDGGLGWLRSDKQYKNFEVLLNFSFLKKSPQDGGVFLRTIKQGNPWPQKFYEVQLENSERIAMIFGAIAKRNTHKITQLLKLTNEWNTYRIRVENKHLSVYLNGSLVTISNDLIEKTGYIGLQAERGMQAFRHICITELP